jgi:hypothetical protein
MALFFSLGVRYWPTVLRSTRRKSATLDWSFGALPFFAYGSRVLNSRLSFQSLEPSFDYTFAQEYEK